MALTVIAPLRNYANGTTAWGPRAIADTDQRILFLIQRCTSAIEG